MILRRIGRERNGREKAKVDKVNGEHLQLNSRES